MKQFTFSAQVANNLLTVLQGYSKTIRLLLVMFLTLTVSANVWGATYNFSNIPTSGWKTNGGSQTINGKSWTYSSATYVGCSDNAKIQIGSKNNPQTSNWTIQIPISSFGANIKVTKVAITAYTTATTATYDISVNSSSVKSGNLTTSSATYSSNTLNATTGSIVVTLKGSSNSKAMYLSNIAVTYETAAAHTVTWTINPAAGGSLSPTSGTSTTVTPNAAYTYANPAYTVTSGAATVSQSGNTFTATPTANSTIQINMVEKPKYIVTLVPGSGSVTNTELEEPNAGAGVTLPTPTLDCGDWEFAGWKTTSAVTTETTTEPTLIPAGNYKPSNNITLYAVYQRTEGGGSEPTAYSAGDEGDFVIASYNTSNSKWYAIPETPTLSSGKITGVEITVSQTAGGVKYVSTANAEGYTWTIADATNGQTISDGSKYIYHSNGGSSGTNLAYGTSTSYTWEIEKENNGLTFKGMSGSTTYSRGLLFNGSVFGGYALSNEDASGYYRIQVLPIGGGSTTYYISVPDCGIIEPSPSLSADPTSLAFGSVATDSNKEMTFTLTGSNLTANASLQLSGINPGMFSLSSNSVTQSAGSINQTITVTYTPTATGEHTATLTISSTGAESKTVALSGTGTAPAAKYTVTFNAGSGTCDDESLTETSGGVGVTLPTANPPATCATNGWKFAGWWTGSVTETTTSPGELLTAGSNYKPASDCTLYAVYSHTEAGGSGGSSEITLLPSSFPDKSTNNYDSGAERTATENDIEFGGHHITGNASNTPSGATQNQYLQCRASDATIYNKTELPGKITQIVVNQYDAKAFSLYCGSTQLMASDNVDRTQTPSGTKITDVSAATTMTWDVDGNYTFFALKKGSNAGYVQSIIITYSGGGSTTTYNSNPVCVASWSITYDFEGGTGSHCSNTSVPQGDPYTICDEEPTKEGHTFQGWSDGTSTYDGGATFTPTKNTTLTAQWQINTYTVIWSNNGATTPVEYNHGDALVVPEAPESCDGVKEFVGWTTHSGYYHATTAPDDIFTTKTTPVTATTTYYAVFATKGAGGTEFVLGESGTFKMYANVNGTNYYAQGGVSSSKLSSTTDILTASDYTLTYADGSYTIKQGTSTIGHSSSTNLSTTASTWTISAGANGSWRITSDKDNSRALSYSAEANAFKAYATSNLTAGNETYFDIEFGSGSNAYSDYTTICQTVESIEIANYTTEFFVTDEFAFGGTVTAHFDEGEPQDVTALAHFSGYNMNEVGTYTVTVTYMGATATYEITVKPLDNAWVLTWNVSGKTNTGLGPRSVTKGSAIGTLPTPVVPDACAGKTFMGWTESNIVPSDGKGIVYITEETVPTKNTTYYAVFATINNFSTQAAIEDIESGSKVVIVAVASMDASGGAGQAISSRTISITSQGVIGLSGDEVSIFDETINTPHSTCIWTLTKEGGGIVLEQDGNYIRAVNDGYRKLLLETTKDYWTLSPVTGKDKTYHMQSGNTSHYVEWFDHTDSKYDEGERYIGFVPYTEANDNGDFDMQFYVTANADGNADITDYTTGCAEYTITYYGFHGGYSTSCSSDGTIVLPVNSIHTIPDCEGLVINDHTNLGREFLNVWMTQPHGGHTFMPGDTFILTQDTTLYAQWELNTQNDFTTLPTDVEDLAGTDVYVYGGKTLTLQPGTTTINSLTLKGGIQADGSYKMPTVWVPEGATLVRNSNKINLDLIVNAKTYYPFAVPFAAKNNENVEYLDPVLAAASTYGTHFAIKTYNGARRADVGEDKANNWVRVLRGETLQPGVGYIITALTYPTEDTATIRIPMTVPNTWFQNGEQAEVGTTVRNTIAVTAHAGDAATEHQRHAGWNFVANPYLTSFAGGNVANDGGLAYINGELIIEGGYEYTDEEVPYVTIPAYDFAYYSQHKLSDVKLSPEWSFFVQVGTGGTMNFTTVGRQQAPASIAARNAEERPVKMDVDLILSDNHSSDQTGIIISDRYSDAYEIGRDLEKLFGSAYNLSVYTLMEDNTPLAFQALAIRSSMQVIPVGYRAPEQGEYTFRLNEATSSIDLLNEQYEQLVLVDYQTGELTNLLYTDYTFYSERTQSNSRFAIYAVPRQNAPTDLPNAIGSDEEVRKVIYNDHLYILRDGNVYNGMGQKM